MFGYWNQEDDEKVFFPPKIWTPAKVRRKTWWGESSQFVQPVSGKAWWIWCIVNRIQKMQQGGDRRWNQSRRRSKHEVSNYFLSLQISLKREKGIISGHIIWEAFKYHLKRIFSVKGWEICPPIPLSFSKIIFCKRGGGVRPNPPDVFRQKICPQIKGAYPPIPIPSLLWPKNDHILVQNPIVILF